MFARQGADIRVSYHSDDLRGQVAALGWSGVCDGVDVRHAVRTSLARYNAEWLIEKNGLRSPNDARIVWDTASMKVAA